MTLSIISHPAAPGTHNARPDGMAIDAIVIHCTSGDLAAALWLIDNPDPLVRDRISWHYTIARDGSIYQHIADERRAWHATDSFYRGRDDWNNFSIGVALVSDGGEPYTEAQYQALGELIDLLGQTHPINPQCVVGHTMIAIPRGQGCDASMILNWERLRRAAARVWPIINEVASVFL